VLSSGLYGFWSVRFCSVVRFWCCLMIFARLISVSGSSSGSSVVATFCSGLFVFIVLCLLLYGLSRWPVQIDCISTGSTTSLSWRVPGLMNSDSSPYLPFQLGQRCLIPWMLMYSGLRAMSMMMGLSIVAYVTCCGCVSGVGGVGVGGVGVGGVGGLMIVGGSVVSLFWLFWLFVQFSPVCQSWGFVGCEFVGFEPLIFEAGIWRLSWFGFPEIGMLFPFYGFGWCAGVGCFAPLMCPAGVFGSPCFGVVVL